MINGNKDAKTRAAAGRASYKEKQAAQQKRMAEVKQKVAASKARANSNTFAEGGDVAAKKPSLLDRMKKAKSAMANKKPSELMASSGTRPKPKIKVLPNRVKPAVRTHASVSPTAASAEKMKKGGCVKKYAEGGSVADSKKLNLEKAKKRHAEMRAKREANRKVLIEKASANKKAQQESQAKRAVEREANRKALAEKAAANKKTLSEKAAAKNKARQEFKVAKRKENAEKKAANQKAYDQKNAARAERIKALREKMKGRFGSFRSMMGSKKDKTSGMSLSSENAPRSTPTPVSSPAPASSAPPAPKVENLNVSALRKGGKVKKYARGGGIEVRGKTKGKFV